MYRCRNSADLRAAFRLVGAARPGTIRHHQEPPRPDLRDPFKDRPSLLRPIEDKENDWGVTGVGLVHFFRSFSSYRIIGCCSLGISMRSEGCGETSLKLLRFRCNRMAT